MGDLCNTWGNGWWNALYVHTIYFNVYCYTYICLPRLCLLHRRARVQFVRPWPRHCLPRQSPLVYYSLIQRIINEYLPSTAHLAKCSVYRYKDSQAQPWKHAQHSHHLFSPSGNRKGDGSRRGSPGEQAMDASALARTAATPLPVMPPPPPVQVEQHLHVRVRPTRQTNVSMATVHKLPTWDAGRRARSQLGYPVEPARERVGSGRRERAFWPDPKHLCD